MKTFNMFSLKNNYFHEKCKILLTKVMKDPIISIKDSETIFEIVDGRVM